MNLTLKTNLKLAFCDFNIDELKKIKNLNFSKIITKAKILNQKHYGCTYCYKPNPQYYFDFYNIGQRKGKVCRHYKYSEKFCSEKCLSQYLSNPNVEEQTNCTFLDQVVKRLALFLSIKELSRIKKSDFQAEMQRRIQNYQKNLLCDYCHKVKKKRYILEINKTTEKRMSLVLDGEFCSQECLKNYFKEKTSSK